MSNDLTPDQAAFRQFELDGWKTSAPVYFDAIVGVNSQSVPALLDAAGVAAGVRVLDLACGPGHIAAAAAQRGAQVTGVDFSPQMLAQARRRYPDIAFQAGDAEALPLADASVDAVVMGYALFHFARPERALAECARVLRPGGRVAFTAWALPVPGSALAIANACLKAHATLDLGLPEGTPFHRFSEPDECRRVLTAAGFVDVGFRTVPQRWRMATADDLYEGLSRASVRMKTVFQRQTPDVQQRLRAAMRQAVEAHATDDGYVLQMPAALSWAQKPA
jgi:SAM-dependent methyltransferase